MCNYMGNEAWVDQLDTRFGPEFQKSRPLPWVTIDSNTLAGTVRSAGGSGATAGNVTFVTVYDAGYVFVSEYNYDAGIVC
jgi:cathepsin A (carboxypeptidase C)